jgi:hypothetical protein
MGAIVSKDVEVTLYKDMTASVLVSCGVIKCHDKMVYNFAMVATVSWSSSLVVVDLFYPGGGGVLVGRNALLDKWVRSLAHGIISLASCSNGITTWNSTTMMIIIVALSSSRIPQEFSMFIQNFNCMKCVRNYSLSSWANMLQQVTKICHKNAMQDRDRNVCNQLFEKMAE